MGLQALCLSTCRKDQRAVRPERAVRAGFSIIDLMVSMAVIAVLIALMMPSLSTVRETARRVVCASNVRQHGLGIAMYADDEKGFLPPSKFGNSASRHRYQPQMMMVLRTDFPETWDGLGVLFHSEYLDAAGVFYCPSHRGGHSLARYSEEWAGGPGQVVGNYQYRGGQSVRIESLDPGYSMATDGMRSRVDYNHQVGSNVLRLDLRVGWFSDPGGALASALPFGEDDPNGAAKVNVAWSMIDEAARSSP
jgi:hypothetical protein